MNEEQKIRFAEALHRLSGDCDLLVAMASMVKADAPVIWREVQDHMESEQWQDMAASGHKLKGMLSTFDTGSPIPELQEMIVAARKERISEAKACFGTCRPAVEQLMREITDLGAA